VVRVMTGGGGPEIAATTTTPTKASFPGILAFTGAVFGSVFWSVLSSRYSMIIRSGSFPTSRLKVR